MRKTVLIIIFAWLLIIGVFVFKNEYTVCTGHEVLLETIPVDPRDLFRGDYVILNYAIASDKSYRNYKNNQIVYVKLKTDDKNVAHIDKVTEYRPHDGLYIRGKIQNSQSKNLFNPQDVEFGIENYFVKEGTGIKLQRDLRNGALVKVAVDKFGKAKVKGFVISESH